MRIRSSGHGSGIDSDRRATGGRADLNEPLPLASSILGCLQRLPGVPGQRRRHQRDVDVAARTRFVGFARRGPICMIARRPGQIYSVPSA